MAGTEEFCRMLGLLNRDFVSTIIPQWPEIGSR